jgi:hypothetical protein
MVSVIDLMQYMQYRVDCCFPGILQSEILVQAAAVHAACENNVKRLSRKNKQA